MKFMILLKSNPGLEQSVDAMSDAERKEAMAKMGAFNEELKQAGVMKDCDGLRPSCDGKRVCFDGESRAVVDGPFEGDLVAGYWIWELPNIEDAVAWLKRCPNPMPAPSEIEIRPYWVFEDRSIIRTALTASSNASLVTIRKRRVRVRTLNNESWLTASL